ncbi:FAD-dependent oxidoreductase [Selenomonas ruminantium]|uniref:Tat (Twin-arginine translocation) pathway signal sequence n=1 Tax=Selenomonas ruminantium TaxID=971 RepID=A0A1I0VJW0_SELRU|nr:FAD-dependent oxidoreductase [Selenomonas ruminantium]SFA76612.1 Tat (twin-arginine translocation) pathway signal sequence [Selenomonas ruminantium]
MDKQEKSFALPISRRDFMKMTGMAAAGLVMGSSIPAEAKGAATMDFGQEKLPVLYEADVCVAGGGPAGTAAAINAARNGAKTVLIERGTALGGLAVLGCVYPFMDTHAPDSDTPYVAEIKKRLRQHGIEPFDGVTQQTWHNPETLALIYDEMCAEAGVNILYQTVLVDTVKEGAKITALIVQTIAGLAAIKAKVFVDATGDAYLARSAGVPYERGYEKTGNNQPLSFRFEMGGIDVKRLYQHVAIELKEDWCKSKPPYFEIAEAMHRKQRYKLEELMAKGVESGELTQEEAEYMQAYTIIGKNGVMSMNCPEIPVRFSATDPISYSKAVTFGRRMMHNIASYLIRHLPGFENAFISREAAMLGARESWRIRGKHYLVEDDYHNQSRFPDAVCRTAWFIDAHGEKVSEKLPKGGFYEIPYRSLVTNEIPNLLVAGRCISASFILQASMRIQPTCMSIGEAAGIAAAWGVKHKTNVNEVRWEDIPAEKRSYVSKKKD